MIKEFYRPSYTLYVNTDLLELDEFGKLAF